MEATGGTPLAHAGPSARTLPITRLRTLGATGEEALVRTCTASELMESAPTTAGEAVRPGLLEWLAVFVLGALGTYLRLQLSNEAAGNPEVAFAEVSVYWSSNVFGTLLIALANGLGAGPTFWSKVLHRGVVVGFCGGLTTFSSFISEAVKNIKTHKHGVDDLVESCVLTMCGALGAYFLGWHMALVAQWILPSSPRWVNAFSQIVLVLSLVTLAGLGAVSVLQEEGSGLRRLEATAASLGGLGSTVRFTFALLLNRAGHYFCVGTYSANMTAVVVLGATNRFCNEFWSVALGSGFCGGLSTLSSLCNEYMIAVIDARDKAREEAEENCATNVQDFPGRGAASHVKTVPKPARQMLGTYLYILVTVACGAAISAVFTFM